MIRRLVYVALFCLAVPEANAHRLDEYLQATIFSLQPGTMQGTMRLVPGVAVAPQVITSIDTNGDGVLSPEEQNSYAKRVLSELQLKEDGRTLQPHLLSSVFPSTQQIKSGTGEIELAFAVTFPRVRGHHEFQFENDHQRGISVYLVNSLVPRDRNLLLGAQVRNQTQSVYRLAFSQDSSHAVPESLSWSGFRGAFRLGARHIANGTDHLLFLLVLLLPAPLLAIAGRWREVAPLRRTSLQIFRIVTAFTLGHSLTLALSAFGIVHLPTRPVEVLIAVSISVSGIHAIRPLFSGREVLVAGFFGLVHGLAFASALNELGVFGWYRLVSLFGFNLGIEAMQLAVIAATLPAFVLLSRTRSYPPFRVAAALLALLASAAWVCERISERPNEMSGAIQNVARHGLGVGVALWTASLLAWFRSRHAAVVPELE